MDFGIGSILLIIVVLLFIVSIAKKLIKGIFTLVVGAAILYAIYYYFTNGF